MLSKQYSTATLENSLSVSLKTKHSATIQPGNCIPGHLSQRNKNSYSHKTCMWIFLASLFVIAKNWKQARCSSTGEQLNKLVHPYHGIPTQL